jgi:hypothetical protein
MNVTGQADRPAEATKGVAPSKPADAPPKLRWRTVLTIVVPVALLAAAALAFIRFGDTDALLNDLTRPALAPAKGNVMYKGQPLGNAQVMTEPTAERGLPAMGWTDDEGNFSLKTDIKGTFVEGITVGEHRVTVTARERISVPGGPPLVTPEQYASMKNSPLSIKVGSNPAENQFKFVLEGDPPSRPGRGKAGDGAPVQMKAPGGPPKKKGPSKDKATEAAPTEP